MPKRNVFTGLALVTALLSLPGLAHATMQYGIPDFVLAPGSDPLWFGVPTPQPPPGEPTWRYLFQNIDEASPNGDTDYIRQVGGVIVIRLTKPTQFTGWSSVQVRIQVRKQAVCAPPFCTVFNWYLFSNGTTIASQAGTGPNGEGLTLPTTWTEVVYTLDSEDLARLENADIDDEFRFHFSSSGHSSGPAYDVSMARVLFYSNAADQEPPCPIADLQADLFCSQGGTLSWHAPTDDCPPIGPGTGPAAAYELRRSLSPITDANFGSANLITTPSPGSAGSSQSATVSGLIPCRHYYFAIRTRDENNNWSALGFAEGTTLCAGPGECEALTYELPDGSQGTDDATRALQLSAPVPSPSRSATRILYSIPDGVVGADIDIGVFDVSGRRLRTLAGGTAMEGRFAATWDLKSDQGVRVAPGAYFVLMRVGATTLKRPLIVLP